MKKMKKPKASAKISGKMKKPGKILKSGDKGDKKGKPKPAATSKGDSKKLSEKAFEKKYGDMSI